MNMNAFADRLLAWKSAALAKLKERSWRAWLLVAGLLYILVELVRSLLTDAGTLALVFLLAGISWVLRQPMGVAGLALIVVIGALIVISWWQTRPRPRPKPIPVSPLPVPDAELEPIQEIRTVWNRHGLLATSQLRDVLRDFVYDLEQREYWGELLKPFVDEFDEHIKAVTAGVEFDGGLALTAVHGRFNMMYGTYVRVMRWVAELVDREQVDVTASLSRRLEVWRVNHRAFRERLLDLEQHAAHYQELHIHLNWVESRPLARFLEEAELSDDLRNLIDRSRKMLATSEDTDAAAG